MAIVDVIVGILAPHYCLLCGVAGSVLCESCVAVAGEPREPYCAGCKKLSASWKVCRSCKRWLPLDRVVVAAPYGSLYEQLLHEYKFEFRRQASRPISLLMCQVVLDELFSDCTVIPVPTAPARVRERGFDNGRLLAREVAQTLSLPLHQYLGRSSNKRQVGATRKQRFAQMGDEFAVLDDKQMVAGGSFLLVDDVLTTGATLAAAANALKKAGAKKVSALIFAQKV